jgi:DME family drug/metabolite transporter
MLAIAGLALISITAGSHHGTAPHPWLGIAESIASGLGYAASTLIGARLQPTAGPFALTAMASVVGAVTLLPVAAGAGLAFHPDARTVSSLAYMGIVATAVAYWLFFRGLGSTPSDVAAVLTLLEPLAATLLAVALVGERLAATGWLGGSLLLLAVAVLYLRVESPSVEEELGTRP